MEDSYPKKNKSVSSNNFVPAIYKAYRILELIAQSKNGWMGITEISKALNYSKSTIHSILNTLTNLDYAERDPETKKFGLGIRHYELGNSYRNRTKFTDNFSYIARRILNECDETVFLAILNGTDIIYMAKEESSQPLRMAERVGARLPAHITALGKCLLSAIPDDEIDKLYKKYMFIKATANSIDNLQDLKRELEMVRKQGFATDNRETNIDVDCVGAPIINDRDQVVAAISIALPHLRMKSDHKDKLIKLIKENAKDFSKRLGNLDHSEQTNSFKEIP